MLDTLVKLREKYGDDEFGKQYNALYGALRDGFAALGATEFAVVTGDVVDKTRTVVVDSEYSTEFPVNAVIRPVTVGMELQGNVLRMAECVASLGAEPAAVAEEKESVAAESADDESSEDEQQEGESNEN